MMLFTTVIAAAALAAAGADGAAANTFTERFPARGEPGIGRTFWWDRDAWDVRADTHYSAQARTSESDSYRGNLVAIRSGGTGSMRADFQGILSARLRNPLLIGGKRPATIDFDAPMFVTTGHWWEVAVTPADRVTAGEYTAVPGFRPGESLDSPIGGSGDGSTNGPGHRAGVADSINVISTGYPDAPACNESGWHVRWAVTKAIDGRVTDHVNRRPDMGALAETEPEERDEQYRWRIVLRPRSIELWGDLDEDDRLERIERWAVRVPWPAVHVHLLYVAYQAGHHPQPGCGLHTHGIAQAQTMGWRNVRVSPVRYARTHALPRDASGWRDYDLRALGYTRVYDRWRDYLACSVGGHGGLPCPERATRDVRLPVDVPAERLSSLRLARLVLDARYEGDVGVIVNGRHAGVIRGTRRLAAPFEPEAWVRRSIDLPAGSLRPGRNEVRLALDPRRNVEVDRVELELARG